MHESIQLSVVIAAHDVSRVIQPCLAALEAQTLNGRVEVIVADSSRDGTVDLIERQFTWVRLLRFEPPLTIPELRGKGIAAARGDIIAILDPFSVAAPDWVDRVLQAHERRSHAVIGGSVDLYQPALRSLADWAVYFNEYGLFMPPAVEGETWIVPGSNLSYKRTALWDGARVRHPVFWKTFVNWELARSGRPLWLASDVKVSLNKPLPFADFLRTRYHHGRCFAGMRVESAPAWIRTARAASAFLLPFVLLWRWTLGFWPKRRHRLRFVLTLPAQFALFTVWAWGELCGYLWGTGRSCQQLFY